MGAPSKIEKVKWGFAAFQVILLLIMIGSYLQRLFQPIQVQVTCPVPPSQNCCCYDNDGGTDDGSDASPHG